MLINNDEYLELFHKIIDCIKTSQYKVVVGANLTLLHRNWRIGTFINEIIIGEQNLFSIMYIHDTHLANAYQAYFKLFSSE